MAARASTLQHCQVPVALFQRVEWAFFCLGSVCMCLASVAHVMGSCEQRQETARSEQSHLHKDYHQLRQLFRIPQLFKILSLACRRASCQTAHDTPHAPSGGSPSCHSPQSPWASRARRAATHPHGRTSYTSARGSSRVTARRTHSPAFASARHAKSFHRHQSMS